MVKKSVLVVAPEDEENGELVNYLEQRGFSAELVYEESQALELFHRRRYDIVLLDSELPGLAVCDFVQTILGISPSTSVIVITATERPSELHRAVESGVTCYARKPFDRERLLLQMKEL